jgi:hypothetical protein
MGTKVGLLNRPERSDAAVPGRPDANVADFDAGQQARER